MKSSAAFDKNTVEFVTVAAEYCSFLEQVYDKEPERVMDVLCKLLPLVYLKATMLEETEPEGLYLEESVTEAEYEEIRTLLAQKLGENDDYLEVFVEDMKYSDTPVRKCISEDLADIYQALAEERIYKEAYPHDKIIHIMKIAVEKGEIDGSIVNDIDKVFGNYDFSKLQ